MKKLLLAIGLIALVGVMGYCVDQAHSLGTVTFNVKSQTLSQIVNSTATAVGQLVYCSNCTQSYLCVATGTANFNQYATIGSSASTVGVCK